MLPAFFVVVFVDVFVCHVGKMFVFCATFGRLLSTRKPLKIQEIREFQWLPDLVTWRGFEPRIKTPNRLILLGFLIVVDVFVAEIEKVLHLVLRFCPVCGG